MSKFLIKSTVKESKMTTGGNRHMYLDQMKGKGIQDENFGLNLIIWQPMSESDQINREGISPRLLLLADGSNLDTVNISSFTLLLQTDPKRIMAWLCKFHEY